MGGGGGPSAARATPFPRKPSNRSCRSVSRALLRRTRSFCRTKTSPGSSKRPDGGTRNDPGPAQDHGDEWAERGVSGRRRDSDSHLVGLLPPTSSSKPFGTLVNFVPRVSDEGDILLTVSPEVSQPDFSQTVEGIPSFRTRRAATSARLRNGQTLVIGGLLQNDREERGARRPVSHEPSGPGIFLQNHDVQRASHRAPGHRDAALDPSGVSHHARSASHGSRSAEEQ